MKLMRTSVWCVQWCQFRDLDFNNDWIIGRIDQRKVWKALVRFFIFAKKKIFLFQFHVNLEYYILGSQIRVNFIDFNCYCLCFKTAILGTADTFARSWGRLIYFVLKTSDWPRLEDVWFMSSWRRPIYYVLKTSDLRRLYTNVVATSIERRKKWYFLTSIIWNIQKVLSPSVSVSI